MFGKYKPPFKIEQDGIRLSCEPADGGFLYSRHGPGSDNKELLILSKKIEFLINPIEPVNLPKPISHFLYVELQNRVVLGPDESTLFYIKFPVEISVFTRKGRGQWDSIDIFSFSSQKFTLYGEVTNGHICRYYSSSAFTQVPETDPFVEGVMEVEAKNKTDLWAEVGRIVFDAYQMKIYYDEKSVTMRSYLEIETETVAETTFRDSPLRTGMKKSLELYTTRKLPILADRYVMEWGY